MVLLWTKSGVRQPIKGPFVDGTWGQGVAALMEGILIFCSKRIACKPVLFHPGRSLPAGSGSVQMAGRRMPLRGVGIYHDWYWRKVNHNSVVDIKKGRSGRCGSGRAEYGHADLKRNQVRLLDKQVYGLQNSTICLQRRGTKPADNSGLLGATEGVVCVDPDEPENKGPHCSQWAGG